MQEKTIYKNDIGYITRRTEDDGRTSYFLFGNNGQFIRLFSSVYDIHSMRELFPNLAREEGTT